MQDYRKKIDEIDQKIITLLGERMDLAKKIGKFKKEAGMPVEDVNRENKLKDELKKLAKQNNLSDKFVDRLYDVVLDEARGVQG